MRDEITRRQCCCLNYFIKIDSACAPRGTSGVERTQFDTLGKGTIVPSRLLVGGSTNVISETNSDGVATANPTSTMHKHLAPRHATG